MSDTTLRDLVLKRLDAETKPEDEWSALVLAALEGPDELAKLLDGPLSFRAPSVVTGGEESAISAPASAPPAPPSIAFLRTITVEGFRGIGPKATLDLTPGPGLTLVVGRNGSGKSSFAEGLELLLTGDTYRWRDRSRIWRDGWRNLHHPKAALAADFALEGERGACTVACEWPEGAELEAATRRHRPFLSYNELGSLLDEGPSKLYDALAKVLGLDALVDACGLRLRWSVDADQGARQSSSASHRDIDRGRQPIDIVILGADHDPGMSREAGVQTDELPPVQGEHGPAGVRSELQDGMVRDSLVGLARLEGRQPIVSQLSEGVDDLEGEVLVRVERGHGLRGLVLPDRLVDLLPVCVRVRPRVDEVRGSESGVVDQDLRLVPSEASEALEHPDGDARADDAGAASADSRGLLDPRPGVTDLLGEPLHDLSLLRLAQGGQLRNQIAGRHALTESLTRDSVPPARRHRATLNGPKVPPTLDRAGPEGKFISAEALDLLLARETYRCRPILRPVRLERRGGAPSGVPEGDDLYLTQAGGHTVVHVVADTREVNATQSGGPTGCRHSTRGLIGNDGQSGGKIVSQRTGCRGSVGCPPGGGSLHLTRRAARDNDRKGRHVQPERRRSSSAAEMTSPRSASAIDSASSASWAAVSSKGASRSSAMTVTRDPSGRSTPSSGTIAPPLTKAVKTCMDIVYPRRIAPKAMLNGPKVPPTPDSVGPNRGRVNV